jgi:FAD dependent oxidoreductase TIGR03364
MASVDVAVVGGGIVGLAHAWAAARRGLSVVLFERHPAARGASVRNFGMVWPVGQPDGELYQAALASRNAWLSLAKAAGLSVQVSGSLHLARADDELAVLEEFAVRSRDAGRSCQLLKPAKVGRAFPAVRQQGLRAAFWSPTELCVDPRQALARLPGWLADTHHVTFQFGTTVTAVEMPQIRTATGQTWRAKRVVVCGGADFETLFPDVFRSSGLRRCKLQMMRTPPQPGQWRLGPHIAGGLTLCHYSAFRACVSLERLRRRIHEQYPRHVQLGIHVMAAQNHLGEVVIGDSHEYDQDIEPFDKPEIDRLILDYLRELVELPDWTIAARWHGVYATHPTLAQFTAEPQPGCSIQASPGGAGMTLSFGLAERFWENQGDRA